ncbi:unnamed protein product, partial [marine sediment metagenome]
MNYQNGQGEAIQIKFIADRSFKLDVILSPLVFNYMLKDKLDIKSLNWATLYLKGIDRTKTNYIVVSPLAYNSEKELFETLNNQLTEELGDPILFSTDGFLYRVFPRQSNKDAIINEWISIREQILMNLRIK